MGAANVRSDRVVGVCRGIAVRQGGDQFDAVSASLRRSRPALFTGPSTRLPAPWFQPPATSPYADPDLNRPGRGCGFATLSVRVHPPVAAGLMVWGLAGITPENDVDATPPPAAADCHRRYFCPAACKDLPRRLVARLLGLRHEQRNPAFDRAASRSGICRLPHWP